MNVIEFERWKPSADDPGKLEYDGQRTAAEVFEELKHRLEGQGYLPDEYFLLDDFWKNGREIPKDAGIFCTTDYGGSEGVYLDAYLKWYDKGQEKSVTQKFLTGKTLGENGNDLDRMFLISSAITKAFHGDNATHVRHMKIDGIEDDTGGRVVHLSQQEEKVIIEALVEQRERQEQAMSQTEQLLRRITGSITAYMDTVGQRPLHLSDYDRTVLAIRDGELSAFRELYPKLLDSHADDLLIEAAGRPGLVGRQMSLLLLEDGLPFSEPAYRAACEKAININDLKKISYMLEHAETYTEDLPPCFQGEMASYAYLEHRPIAKAIIKQCTDEQIAAAPSRLLEQFAGDKDFRTLSTLVKKGISGGPNAWRTLHMLTCGGHNNWIAEDMLKKRMWVDTNDHGALHACIQNDAVEVCKLLLDGGMDFDQYRQWAETHTCADHEDTLQALAEHWEELKTAQAQGEQAPQQTGGMTLG
nr:ankyrin repeat domain-containing protein [uncultured Oscillibacter sp.]